jgi:hypothetical protein
LSPATRSLQNAFILSASRPSGSRSCDSAAVLFASPLAAKATWTRVAPSPQSKRAERGSIVVRSRSSTPGSQRARWSASTNAA